MTTQTLFGRCLCHDKTEEENRFFQGRTERHTSRSRSMRKSESAAKPSSALMVRLAGFLRDDDLIDHDCSLDGSCAGGGLDVLNWNENETGSFDGNFAPLEK